MTQNPPITRFAPSPTGYLHLGNYRTAIFAYLFARKEGGSFIVRIEDTDRERSRPEYEQNIFEALDWLGLERDKTFRQSEQAPRHEELLRQLIEEGKAYVSKEEPSEEGRREEVIRFRNPNTRVSFTDLIRGDISFDTTELGDFIIARSFTEPVFHFAVVVDDYDEGVTHVIRGEDHISNTPRQILIGQAIGAPLPQYAHLPLVLGPDKAKLSKRRGAKALTQYRDEGYLPEAVLNGIAMIGWHPHSEQELFGKEELVREFDLARIQRSSAIFDEEKMRWFNHEHLKRLSDRQYAQRFKAYLDGKGWTGEYAESIAPLLKERAATFGEALELIEQGEFAFLGALPSYPSELLIKGAKTDAETVKKHLSAASDMLSALSESQFSAEEVKNAVFGYATEQGRASVLWPLRIALSGKERSPDPFTIAHLIGKEKTLSRIAEAIEKL